MAETLQTDDASTAAMRMNRATTQGPGSGVDLVRALACQPIPRRWLVLAPHPDDETVSAGIAISRMTDVYVVHITDGAPRESGLWTAPARSRADYRQMRRREVTRALAIAGVSDDRLIALDIPDQEATWHIAACARKLAAIIERIVPDAIVTPPYEGGHPDHDATALAARLALARARPAVRPVLVEMTSYHLFDGRLRSGTFIDDSTAPGAQISLTARDRAHKDRMLDAFVTQRDVLAKLRADRERFRLATSRDFSRPPHPRPLYYETLGWPMTWPMWRDAAARAIAELSGGRAA